MDQAAKYGADGRSRTGTGFPTTPSRWRVYQFHHIGKSYTFLFSRAIEHPCPLFAFKRAQPDILSGVKCSLPAFHPISPHRQVLYFFIFTGDRASMPSLRLTKKSRYYKPIKKGAALYYYLDAGVSLAGSTTVAGASGISLVASSAVIAAAGTSVALGVTATGISMTEPVCKPVADC